MKKTFLLGWQHWVAVGICSVAMLLVSEAKADLVGPYTNDANTLVLLHFNESAGSSVTANAGSLGRNFYAVDENPNSTTPPLLTSLLGGAGYVSGSTDFGNSTPTMEARSAPCWVLISTTTVPITVTPVRLEPTDL